MDARDRLPMGEVSRRSGFAASALRYYESQGLIEAERSAGGQRTFQRSVLRRLAFIRAASNIGLTLEEIRQELDCLPAGRTPTKSDWHRISGRGARAAAGRARLVHRVRLPVAQALPDRKPGGRRREERGRGGLPAAAAAPRPAAATPGRHPALIGIGVGWGGRHPRAAAMAAPSV
jgi:redox-sensitive transcriptional activator SoxR